MKDWRNLAQGRLIPTEQGYCDQPSFIETKSRRWLLCITTGKREEGAAGEHVALLRSEDQGRSWSAPEPIEDPRWESAYGAMACAPGGRVFCFYCYNLLHIDAARLGVRYDMGGAFCFRYSDDEGESWSERHVIPFRRLDLDDASPQSLDGQELRFFWNVSRPFFQKDVCYVPLIHYAPKGTDILHASKGTLLRCRGLAQNPDAVWETLPEGDGGIDTPVDGGRVAEEQSFVILSDRTIFCVFRTRDGHPAYTLSRDGGAHFQPPQWLRFATGELIKHPRAANFLWPLGNGEYLYWFHHRNGPQEWRYRNPVWVSLARETQGVGGKTLSFSKPEIFLYDEDLSHGISYPHLLQSGGSWFVSETNKTVARIHPVPDAFVARLRAPALPAVSPVWQAPGPLFPFTLGPETPGFTLYLAWRGPAADPLFRLNGPESELEIIAREDTVCLSIRIANEKRLYSSPLPRRNEHCLALALDSMACVAYFVADGQYRLNAQQENDFLLFPRQKIMFSGAYALSGEVTCARLYDVCLMTGEMELLTR